MKKLLTTFLIITTVSVFAQTSKRALFLGNSYTNVNNLPQIVADIATSTGDTLIVDSNTPGGYTLQGHTTNATSINKIKLGNWDFVVLQEQSQLPSFTDSDVEGYVFPYARTLDSIINVYNSCSETIFYMTWGRKNGDASNCVAWPPICTYEGMDSLLHLRYMMMADSNNAIVSPVGAVWNYIRQNYPSIELYQSDESHPSAAGSYAAACSFYTSIFRKNPLSIPYNYSLSASDAANIRLAVKTIVYDDFLEWHIGEYDPIANFSFTASANDTVVFNNLSINATSYEWNFGDGNTSTVTNPSHTYLTSGNYSVTLIANYCTYSDTIVLSINSSTTGIENNQLQNGITLYPNPVSNQLTVSLAKVEKLYFIDAIGKTFSPFYATNGTNTSIDFSSFAPGIYFLVIETNGKLLTQKVIKQ